MKRTVCLTCLVLIPFLKAASQAAAQTLTLKQAVEAAFKNNLQVLKSDLQTQTDAVNARQAKENLLPDLFGNASHGINQGRSINPFTNSYINQQVNYASYGLNSQLVLFNGFQLMNLIKQNNLTYQAGKMDLQQTKDNVMLNVILAYLQILTSEELLEQSKNQAAVTRTQVERLTTMNEAGAIAPATLYDLKGQLANDELAITDNQNALNTARLSLAQLMNVPYQQDLQVQNISADTLFAVYSNTPASLYDISVKQLAIVKAAELRRQSAQKGVKVAQGYYYPTLALNGGLNTYYSNAATRDFANGTTDVATGDFVSLNGGKVPVMTTKTLYNTQKISYSDQFNNNYNTSVYLSLQIPIFNKFTARNRVALARIDLRNAEITAQTVKTQLSQNIEQAYFSMTAAMERYKVSQQQVSDFSESFRTAEVRFDAGAINQVDYLVAKNNVDRARINLISARYDYIFRIKILDYYRNELILE